MPNEPFWLAAEQVIGINQAEVGATGEPFALRDQALLESACNRPRFAWNYGEEDIVHLATTLLFGIARNHPFLQGNKRTGFTAAAVFVEANGYTLSMPDSETIADMIIRVIDGELDEGTFEEFFRIFVE